MAEVGWTLLVSYVGNLTTRDICDMNIAINSDLSKYTFTVQ